MTELPLQEPLWDGRHDTSVPGKPSDPSAQARCSCGWLGDVHTGHDRRWQASCDADDHANGLG